MCGGPQKEAWSALTVLLAVPVRITPLGSPTRPLKRSYVHVPSVLDTVFVPGTSMSAGGVVYPGWCGWVGTGWVVLPPWHPPSTLVLPGPNHCLKPAYLRPPGTPEALLASSAHLAPRTQIWPSLPIRARFRVIYPKVSDKTGVSTKYGHEAWHTPCFKNCV